MCLCQPLPSLTLCCSFFFAQCSRVWKKVQLHIWIICEVFEHFFSQVTLEESQLHYCSIFCTALWFCPLASARMIATQSLSLTSHFISYVIWLHLHIERQSDAKTLSKKNYLYKLCYWWIQPSIHNLLLHMFIIYD